ncbi:MAG TPA: hypothetical protein DD619_02005, partial [Alphaproteobacteria bacterium]|nr:hypothetical protein [Alphaproteobacteria bacterium]
MCVIHGNNIYLEINMLRLSHRGLGLLNVQYRSVLKKCFMLNLAAAAFVLPAYAADEFTPHQTANTSGSGNSLDAKGEEVLNNLKNQMGTVISSSTETSEAKPLGYLYINTNFTEEHYSDDILVGSDNNPGPWIWNRGEVYSGYQYNFTTGQISEVTGGVTISNKHNTSAMIPMLGGGVFVNGKEDGSMQPLLKVINTTFLNNSASAPDTTLGQTVMGGVISNYSQNTENSIKNSTFSKNYVMGADEIAGGAVSNFAVAGTARTDVGYMLSQGNQYSGNYAANETDSTNTLLTQFVGTEANKASGGAVYNSGTFISEKDIFSSNYAKGATAQGGAVYNGVEAGNTGTFTLTGDGSTNFSGNHAEGSALAAGGAVANAGDFSSESSKFENNYAKSDTKATGGAVSNSGTYTSQKESYSGNYTTAADSLGGAVYNDQTGTLTITGAASFSGNYAAGTGTTSGTGALGGAFYNAGTLTATDGNLTFSGNYATGNMAVKGGAFGNASTGTATLKDVTFSGNYTASSAGNVYGGSVYNEGKITITGAAFENNYSKTTSDTGVAYGGAWANSTAAGESLSPVSQIIDSSFKNNQAVAASENAEYGALGGAIYNRAQGSDTSGNLSILQIIASGDDVEFSSNKAVSAAKSGIGGAIANNNLGQLDITADNNHSIIFKYNEADYGGAIANSAAGNTTNNASGEIARLTVNATGGDIAFTNNSASQHGGVLFNYAMEDGMTFKASGDHSLIFSNNTAGSNGGAFANQGGINPTTGVYEQGYILLDVSDKALVNFSGNSAGAEGGAVYNMGKLVINTDSAASSAQIKFAANTAKKGGAIYNTAKANVSGALKNGASLLFDGNKASDGQGGAIYNEADGNIDLSLSGTSKIVFSTAADDVYNLGTITISGDLPNPTLAASAVTNDIVLPRVINNSQSQIVLNSTFGGSGTYNISNTQLNIGSSGYIDYTPEMVLKNNIVNLASGSYLNLDSGDTLVNNDFDISGNSTLNYKADAGTTALDLANTVQNAGLLNLGDGVLTDVSINTLYSENGTIRIDVDNPNLKADRIIINNKIYGTTDIRFDNADSMTLGLDDRIYFAQTQAEQSLDDYKFVSKINNGLYEIGIGYENNTAVNDWFFYRTKYLNPEVIAYIDLPRSAVEQSRSLLFNAGRLDKGSCNCYRDECNYKVCNFKDLGGKDSIWATPVYRSGTFDKPVETDVKLYGLDFGYDHQFTISDQFGIFGSYRDGTYDNSGKGEGEIMSRYGSELDITSILGGAYYRKYFGDLFMTGAVYGGMQSADIKADNDVSASTDGLNLGAQVEVGYDFRPSHRSVLTPSIKATYDYIKFDDLKDNSGKEVSFDAVHDIELEAGIKYEYQFNNEHQLPTTGYIKPSVIQTIANGGDVKINDVTFDKTLENETLG